MNVGVTSAILASVVSLTVAIAILFRRPRRKVYYSFSAFSFALFFWHSAALASRLGGTPIFTLQSIAATLIPPTAMFFFRELLRDRDVSWRNLTIATIPISALALAVALSPVGDAWVVQAMLLLYVAGALLLVARAMYQHIREAETDAERKRLSYLLYGGLAALVLAGGELITSTALPAAFGHMAVTFYVYFLYQSIIARRLIDLVELLGKAAVVASLTLVLATVYAVLVLWVGEDEPGLWLFNTLLASFVILILYDQVRPFIEETTTKLLFRRRYELGQGVGRLLHRLRTTISLEEMRDKTLETLVNSGRAQNAAIYLPHDDELVFRRFGFRGSSPPESLSVAEHATLLMEIRRERKPLLLEHLQGRLAGLPALANTDPTSQRDLERAHEAVATLAKFHATLMLPMVADERIVGVLTLGPESTSSPYTTDEIAALLSVAEACAVVLSNSHEYERLHQRDRLAAIGEMATGMAHEIRNPLGAIKGAAQCLDPADLPPEATEFLDVIVEEVDRLDTVVSQFLEYARPYRGNPRPTDVNTVLSATVRLLSRDALRDNIELDVDLAHDLPLVSIDPEQMRQVLLNLTLNAVEAMPEGGVVRLDSLVSHDQTGDVTGEAERGYLRTHILVRVTDSGVGIQPEDLQKIFVPFFTTKDHGTGLGLCITQRIVENAGGRLEVASRSGEGTTFTVRLPAAATDADADADTDAEGKAQPAAEAAPAGSGATDADADGAEAKGTGIGTMH